MALEKYQAKEKPTSTKFNLMVEQVNTNTENIGKLKKLTANDIPTDTETEEGSGVFLSIQEQLDELKSFDTISYKGSVATYADLPDLTTVENGWMYQVNDTHKHYVAVVDAKVPTPIREWHYYSTFDNLAEGYFDEGKEYPAGTIGAFLTQLSSKVGEFETDLEGKVDKVAGKGLSTNDYDNTEKAQVATNKSNIENLQNPDEVTEGKDVGYIKVIGTDGKQKKISMDNFGKEEILHEAAWGVTINPGTSSPTLTMKGNSGMWEEYKEKIGRYLVTNDGKARKLMTTDSTKFVNGDTVDETTGHVMVRIPRLCYKSITNSDGSTTLWMSEEPIGGHEIKEQWVGAYIGQVVNGALVSRSGLNPTRSLTISQFWADAQVNGTDWGLEDYEQRKVMIMLLLSEYLSLNSQGTLGNGMTGTGNNWCTVVQNALTGKTASLGDACGSVDFTDSGQSVSGACHVSLFGIEDPYGWFWEMIQGCYFGSSSNSAQTGTEAFLYEGNRMPSSTELTTKPTGDYRQLTRVTSSNWLKAIIAGEYFDVLPKTLGGSATTYWCDYHYANTTGQLLLLGGYANNGSLGGLAYSLSNLAFSYSSSGIAARLAYYGNIEYLED